MSIDTVFLQCRDDAIIQHRLLRLWDEWWWYWNQINVAVFFNCQQHGWCSLFGTELQFDVQLKYALCCEWRRLVFSFGWVSGCIPPSHDIPTPPHPHPSRSRGYFRILLYIYSILYAFKQQPTCAGGKKNKTQAKNNSELFITSSSIPFMISGAEWGRW